jgi:hypothetical protein
MTEDTEPGVKSTASTEISERTAKAPKSGEELRKAKAIV